jgi:hypothetical protein
MLRDADRGVKIRRHAAGVADLFAAAVDEVIPVSDEDDDEGPGAEALVPC